MAHPTTSMFKKDAVIEDMSQDTEGAKALFKGLAVGGDATPTDTVSPPPAKPFRTNSNLVTAIIRTENGLLNHHAEGSAGERGLMQILPSTARDPGVGVDGIDPDTLWDSATNVQFGTDYLNGIYRHFDFDLDKTIAAWNNGITNVKKAVEKGGDNWLAELESMMKHNKPTDYLLKVKTFLRGEVPSDVS